jgi:hypothetical protein
VLPRVVKRNAVSFMVDRRVLVERCVINVLLVDCVGDDNKAGAEDNQRSRRNPFFIHDAGIHMTEDAVDPEPRSAATFATLLVVRGSCYSVSCEEASSTTRNRGGQKEPLVVLVQVSSEALRELLMLMRCLLPPQIERAERWCGRSGVASYSYMTMLKFDNAQYSHGCAPLQ